LAGQLLRVWVDEAVARAEALRQGDIAAEDGAAAIAELRSDLRTVPSK
jgi:hypothetical protein